MRVARGVLDTSVLIAAESGRAIDADALPGEVVVSVVTLAELRAGVLAARDLDARAARLQTLESLADVQVLDVDAGAAAAWARLRVWLATERRRVNVNDLWIAASAAANGLPIVTQDADFDALAGVEGVRVIRV